jgi:hypothetical protein
MSDSRKQKNSTTDAKWAAKPKRWSPKKVFLIILTTLLFGAGVWSTQRDRAKSIPLDLSEGSGPVVAEIAKSKSLRQLRKLSSEAGQLILISNPDRIRPLLEIVDSSTERQLDLEKSPNLRTEAVLGQLKALDNTSSLNLNSVGEVRWNYERFTRLADSYTEADSVDIRRQARKCRLLAWYLLVRESGEPLDQLEQLRTTVREIVEEHPGDLELLGAIESLWEVSSVYSQDLSKLEALTQVVEQELKSSKDPETANRGQLLNMKYWYLASNLRVRIEEAILSQDSGKLNELQKDADKFLKTDPNNESIELVSKLAAALEGGMDFSGSIEINKAIRDLDYKGNDREAIDRYKKLAAESLERISRYGQDLELSLELNEADAKKGAVDRTVPTPALVTLIQFIGKREELDSLQQFLINIERLRPRGCRQVIAIIGEERESIEEWLVAHEEHAFEVLTPECAEQIRTSIPLSATPRTVIVEDGKLKQTALPNRRLYLELEKRVFLR